MLFDADYYLAINQARWSAAEALLRNVPSGSSCLDVGCGPGWFTARLVERGLVTSAIDARPELVEEARRRVPRASFSVANIEAEQATAGLAPVDVVFCFGLLYHLENPFAAIRHLRRLTAGLLLIETQVNPAAAPDFRLVAEGRNETQGIRFHALIPSRAAIVKMLYVAGFGHVARYTGPVEHEDFHDAPSKHHRREIFVASDAPARLPDIVAEPEGAAPKIDYVRRD